jgi:hypothetical protein
MALKIKCCYTSSRNCPAFVRKKASNHSSAEFVRLVLSDPVDMLRLVFDASTLSRFE